jgi:uncharacterized glyoxalase superfamily protein PhnB
MKFGPIVPILRIFDEAKAREFYLGFLGATVKFEHRFEPNTPLFMAILLGDVELNLSEHHGDGSPGVTIKIQCSDVAAYCAELNAKKYKYYRPGVEDQEYGSRECTVQDGFGNKLIFWQDIP